MSATLRLDIRLQSRSIPRTLDRDYCSVYHSIYSTEQLDPLPSDHNDHARLCIVDLLNLTVASYMIALGGTLALVGDFEDMIDKAYLCYHIRCTSHRMIIICIFKYLFPSIQRRQICD